MSDDLANLAHADPRGLSRMIAGELERQSNVSMNSEQLAESQQWVAKATAALHNAKHQASAQDEFHSPEDDH